jgi:hypothetical protein
MNYAHNNLRLKNIQFKIERVKRSLNKVVSLVTRDKQEVRLEEL